MIKVIVSAKFPQMKPAHNAFIQKTGEGSNYDRAIRNAIQNLFSDERLKGKKKDNLSPVTITVALYQEVSED